MMLSRHKGLTRGSKPNILLSMQLPALLAPLAVRSIGLVMALLPPRDQREDLGNRIGPQGQAHLQ